MKKAEMEHHYKLYHNAMSEARSAEKNGLPRVAVKKALSCVDHIDGMMQFARRYMKEEFDSIEAVELVLKYAPFLLDVASLDKFESMLKSNRRIEKYTSENLAGRIAKARKLLWDTHRIWDHLENHAGTQEEDLVRILGGRAVVWRTIVAVWEEMQLVQRGRSATGEVFTISTSMGRIVPAKCYACGEITEAPKAMLLEEIVCPSCGVQCHFVILMTNPRN